MKNSVLLLLLILTVSSCQKNDHTDPEFNTVIGNSSHILIDDGNCHLFMPNAFTPNSDGLNDVFRLSYFDVSNSNYKLQISNENQFIYFTASKPSEQWDGLSGGVPVYGKLVANLVCSTNCGTSIDTSIYIYSLAYTTQNCIDSPATAILFEDQFDPITKTAPYTSSEIMCP